MPNWKYAVSEKKKKKKAGEGERGILK